jgi:hypothetical protein
MINQYVHLGKIGSGSYGKVVRYLGCANKLDVGKIAG